MQNIQSIKQRFGIIGNSPLLNHAIQVAIQVATTDMNVLITGENGSGKEVFSKVIHQMSLRKHNNFIAINCGAIPEGTIDSELFGHEKGSFTGSVGSRQGYFEVSNKGTIFLDEIAELPLKTQARLLRILENGEYVRVGASKIMKTDVRVVAATNANLKKEVENGTFREDLYYRLNTVPIYVPPLRERGKDIDLLFRKFAFDFSEKYHVEPITLEDNAKNLLLSYRFPGNVRELKNLSDRISVLTVGNRHLTAEALREFLPKSEVSRFPVPINRNHTSDSIPNKDNNLMYRMLFEIQREVKDLKQVLLTYMQGQNHPSLAPNPDYFENKTPNPYVETYPTYTFDANSDYKAAQNDNLDYQKVEDIEADEDDTLSLQHLEKEMIIKALRKHNNKRKYAAQDLGISERTLYRKIKQYDL